MYLIIHIRLTDRPTFNYSHEDYRNTTCIEYLQFHLQHEFNTSITFKDFIAVVYLLGVIKMRIDSYRREFTLHNNTMIHSVRRWDGYDFGDIGNDAINECVIHHSNHFHFKVAWEIKAIKYTMRIKWWWWYCSCCTSVCAIESELVAQSNSHIHR